MEVVLIEMSPASTNNMDLDEDLKKWSRMTKNDTSMPTATDNELPEQMQTCNEAMPAKPPARALFTDKIMEITDTEMLKDSHNADTNKSIETPQNKEK